MTEYSSYTFYFHFLFLLLFHACIPCPIVEDVATVLKDLHSALRKMSQEGDGSRSASSSVGVEDELTNNSTSRNEHSTDMKEQSSNDTYGSEIYNAKNVYGELH